MRRTLLFISIFLMIFGLSPVISLAEDAIVKKGNTVSFDYTLTVDGKVVDSSIGKKPLEYVHGDTKFLPGLSKQIDGMKAGEEKNIILPPDEAYGKRDQNAIKEVPISSLPKEMKPEAGMPIQARYANGETAMVRIAEVKKDTVMMDMNHPLAGQTLNFKVRIVSIK